jgi:hypothetical protein
VLLTVSSSHFANNFSSLLSKIEIRRRSLREALYMRRWRAIKVEFKNRDYNQEILYLKCRPTANPWQILAKSQVMLVLLLQIKLSPHECGNLQNFQSFPSFVESSCFRSHDRKFEEMTGMIEGHI